MRLPDEVAAARLAGKVEGLQECEKDILEALWNWARTIDGKIGGRPAHHVIFDQLHPKLDAIRAKIVELQATATKNAPETEKVSHET